MPASIAAAVQGLAESQLDTVYRPGGWTVRQVVHHVADSHVNAYVRFRWALTDDAAPIKTYRQAAWAELSDARDAPVAVSLALISAIHERWIILLESMGEAEFRSQVMHPIDGNMTLDDLLATYAWHGRHHVAHIASLCHRRGWGVH